MPQWQEVERLCTEALRLPVSERPAFLDRACPSELRREVDALLAQDGSLAAGETQTLVFPESTSIEPGMHLGPYLLESRLGAGGMGEVFRALDTRLRRTVALKVLPQDRSASEQQRRRLLQEARAASALNHPNIVALYDISRDRGADFLVMEYVPGQTLKALIDDQLLNIERMAEIGVQIAAALSAAHAAGVVHRDIKPANVMVTADGQVKVLDFGIAKLAHGSGGIEMTQLTVHGAVMGTVAYMSPEQARGEDVDFRSDIFSLGCVLYQCATGKLPFRGANSAAVMQAILNEHPTAPRSLRPELPRELEETIAWCLAKVAARRPAAADVASELRGKSPVARGTRIEASQPTLAVIPFHFRNAAPDDRFLSVALADAVIHRLNSTGKLLVRPTAAVMPYAGGDAEWTRVAHELNTDLVIEGSIQKMGAKIRVMVQAFRASDGQAMHSAKQDGEMDDLFGLQNRLSDLVAGMFEPSEARPEAVPPTKNARAYELYLRGVERASHYSRADIQSAIELLLRVTEMDPAFADAWAELATACNSMRSFYEPNLKWLELAEHAVAKALELNPVHPTALCGRAQVLYSPARGYEIRAGLRAVTAALKVAPRNFSALHNRGFILFHLGEYEKSAKDIDDALELDPRAAFSRQIRAVIALETGDWDRAVESFDRLLETEPNLLMTNVFAPWALILQRRLAEGQQRVERARKLYPGEPQPIALEAMIAALEGDFGRSQQLADASVQMKTTTVHEHHSWHAAAAAYAVCGQADKAIVQLRRCAEMGMPNYRLFTSDPLLRRLAGNTEYESLMTELRRTHDSYSDEFGLERL